MNIQEAMEQRHSVRQYEERPMEKDAVVKLQAEIADINMVSGLHVQLILNEPKAFDSTMAHYGKFTGVTNYIAMIGRKSDKLDETCGYYGERLVLLAQMLGLNTCWVGLTFRKIPEVMQIGDGEKLAIVIAIGYGKTQGVQHKSRDTSKVSNLTPDSPVWFRNGMKAVMLAPTAVNQQKFTFTQNENKVRVKAGMGFFSRVDLGIVKYHFEAGAGKENFEWT
ncbi:MAG: nitroreductase family protein [Bulleidia sp.]|nr:nitroreductase family protein [Bulleidia sp.]